MDVVSGFSLGFICGAVIGFVVVGAVAMVLYWRAVQKLQAIQAAATSTAVTFAKDQAVGQLTRVAGNWLSRKVKPGSIA